jgi:peptidoglycan/xylan/chitin deacetylase (PgdA/CDA1 family)
MTNDVECFSFEHNRYEPSVAQKVLKQGLPRLLDLYDKYDVNATFFYTGKIVEIEPEVIDIVKERGNHEIGCHGYSHELEYGFDILSLKHQQQHIRRAKRIIEEETNMKIISFRAPAARINKFTIIALENTGFKIDSSICSQRFDGPLSFGAKGKMNWLFAHRLPYHPSKTNPYLNGDSKILELPISALFLAFIGTTMRISIQLTKTLQKTLTWESKRNNKPLIFLMHPNEVIDQTKNETVNYKRGKTITQRFFADSLRQKLKLRCLGIYALKRLEKIIKYSKEQNMEFKSCDEYKKILNSD